MIFQHLGITGAILLFYGFVSYALTRVSSKFFMALMILGLVSIVAFIIKALSRTWQKVIALFAIANTLWIVLYVVTKDKEWASKVTMVAALVLNIGFLIGARALLKDLFQSRSLRFGTTSAFYSIIVGFIVIVINIGSQDFHWQADLTIEQINTLSDQTFKIASELKEPLKITAFMDAQNQQRDAAHRLLDAYQKANKKIEVLFADPDKEKILTQQKNTGDGDLLIEFQGQSHITREISEQGITQAIVKVTRKNTPNICFTSGHGEMSLEGPEDDPRSLSILNASLQNEGYQPRTLELLADQVPNDCSVVVLASPSQAFTAGEAAVFDAYLANGGKLIAALDPLLPNTRLEKSTFTISKSGLEQVISNWGITLGNNLMLEKHLTLFQGVAADLSVRSMNYGNHPVVDPLKGKQTVFNTVQSVIPKAGFSGTTYELIKSADGENSWAETNIDLLFKQQDARPDGNDLKGPVTIAMASEREEPKKTQLLVFGDGDFMSNGSLNQNEFNYDLLLNALSWMSGEVQQISIRPKKIRSSALILSPEQSNIVFYVAIITLPMLVLIFGLNLWWYRRRKG